MRNYQAIEVSVFKNNVGFSHIMPISFSLVAEEVTLILIWYRVALNFVAPQYIFWATVRRPSANHTSTGMAGSDNLPLNPNIIIVKILQ